MVRENDFRPSTANDAASASWEIRSCKLAANHLPAVEDAGEDSTNQGRCKANNAVHTALAFFLCPIIFRRRSTVLWPLHAGSCSLSPGNVSLNFRSSPRWVRQAPASSARQHPDVLRLLNQRTTVLCVSGNPILIYKHHARSST